MNISKVCSQEDKKTKDFFNSGGYISEGYALDRNQVRFNQSSDFVFHHIPNGNLICITSKQVRDYNRHYNCILSKDSNFIAYVSVPPIFCGDKDSIYADFSFKTGFMIEMNTYHLEIIKGDFLGIQEKGLLLCVIFLSFINLQNMLVKHLMRIL